MMNLSKMCLVVLFLLLVSADNAFGVGRRGGFEFGREVDGLADTVELSEM